MRFIAIFCIRFYQILISPFLKTNCRFHPTCSGHALECFKTFSFLKALWYSSKRIIKCHPFHPGGYDPVNDESTL